MNFVEELKWRGMIHDMMPGTEEQLSKEMTTAYVGIDPTADSLHIGHLVSIMMLKHLQIAGHKPLALVGGATGMIGDPSGKSQERNMLSEQELNHNVESIKNQLNKFLDFESGDNKAEMVNNYDWMKDFSFLGFLREIGKHITVNYMMAKDSVKKRISGDAREGLSFTEFTYQLVQGYDFLYLYQTKNCKLQMGGSDQWGNITTGTELIRRKTSGEAFALTCPLITKADGGKFGKTEKGNIWLDPRYTTPYHFYQFWLNCSDTDAEKYIKIFTLFSKEEVDGLVEEHKLQPHLRSLQKALAKDITIRVHSEKDYETALEATEILFGKGTTETLRNLPEQVLLDVFDGVPMFTIARAELEAGMNIVDFLGGDLQVLKSKGETRRALKEGGISINKDKVGEDFVVDTSSLLNNKYILAQRGKKNFFLIKTD
ncbi:MAG: tyrosine--tRNA ligase [Bacteroidetes bacterium]|nr:MAG: tyrosine--tRNA ligase [Bacteroidota bacterium]